MMMMMDDDDVETAEFKQQTKRSEEHNTIDREVEEDYETMVIIDKLRQTGAEFNTKELKQFLQKARKKTKNFRNNQAPVISATAPETASQMMNMTAEEEALLEQDLKTLPDITIKRMSD